MTIGGLGDEPSVGFETQLSKDAFALFVELGRRDLIGFETLVQGGELLHQSSLFGLADPFVVRSRRLSLLSLLGLLILTGLLAGPLLEALSATFCHFVAGGRSAGPRLGDVDLEAPTIDFSTVEARDSASGLVAGLHFDETESA